MILEFGYNRGLPDSVTTAWGARVIAYERSFDLVPDRQVVTGPRKDELLEYLNEFVPFKLLSDQAYLLNQDDEIVFEDDKVIVKGCAQRSFGYCYIAAYFKDETVAEHNSLVAPTIIIVPDAPCPECGAVADHRDESLRFMNRPKVAGSDGVWWWKCYNPACNVNYYEPDTGKVDSKT